MQHEVASYCRICAASCGILVTTEGDQVVSVRGDAAHPGSQGYTCPKGRALPALHHHPNRLSGPTVQGNSTSWEVALDDLATSLNTIVADVGADAIGAYLGTGLAYDSAGFVAATGWLRAIGSRRLFTPATVDNAPVLRAAELVVGHPQANPICDYDRTDLVLIFGSNPVVSHGYGTATPNPIVALRSVQRRGGSIIVFDPLRSETAALADQHVSVRPGSDAEVLAWLVREVLDAPLGTDAAESTPASQRAALRDALVPFTVQRAATAADVRVESLIEVRDAILAARGRVSAWCGTGVTMSRNGLTAELLRWVLLALTDSLDTQDGMRFHRGNAFVLRALRPTATSAPPAGPRSRPELHSWLGQHPCVALNDEIVGGHMRALVVTGANPITAFPQPTTTRNALKSLDFLAVIDVVANELTGIASHVFAGASQLERSDIPMHEHVMARGATCHTNAVVNRSPQRRSTWWIFAQLAFRMTGQHLFGVDPNELSDDDVLGLLASRAAISYDEIRGAGTHGREIPTEFGWVRATLRNGAQWNIAPEILIDRLNELTERAADSRDNFVLIPRRRMRANNSVGDPHGKLSILALMHPDDAAALDIEDGGLASVSNSNGSLEVRVGHDERLRRSVISMSHGDPFQSPGAITSATSEVDLETGMPVASGVSVIVTPLRPVD